MLIDQGNPYATKPPAVLELGLDDFTFQLSDANQRALGREAQWTVFAYMAADCNLAPLMFDDLLEMKSIGANAAVHVLALFDGPLLTDAFIARLEPGTRLGEDIILRFNELDTNKPETLAMALGVANAFPARRRLLVVSGHGSGWQGVLADENQGLRFRREPGRLVLPAVGEECDRLLVSCQLSAQEQLNRVIESRAGQPPQSVDILAFDACYMGNLESVVNFAKQAPLQIVAEDKMPGEGFDYGTLIRLLHGNPNIDPAALSRQLIDATDRYYRAKPNRPGQVTLAVLSSDKLQPFAEAFVRLVQTFALDDASVMAAVDHALRNAWRSWDTATIDIKGFVQQLLAQPLPAATASAARNILALWDELVVACRCDGRADGSNGLSIYAPEPHDFAPDYLRVANELPFGLGIWAWFLGGYYLRCCGEEAMDSALTRSLKATLQTLTDQGIYKPG